MYVQYFCRSGKVIKIKLTYSNEFHGVSCYLSHFDVKINYNIMYCIVAFICYT